MQKSNRGITHATTLQNERASIFKKEDIWNYGIMELLKVFIKTKPELKGMDPFAYAEIYNCALKMDENGDGGNGDYYLTTPSMLQECRVTFDALGIEYEIVSQISNKY